jgi:hypothetical protein
MKCFGSHSLYADPDPAFLTNANPDTISDSDMDPNLGKPFPNVNKMLPCFHQIKSLNLTKINLLIYIFPLEQPFFHSAEIYSNKFLHK